MERTQTAAVVIVAWQDGPHVDAALEGLAAQSDPDFCVVVADNGAGLAERLAPWRERLRLDHLDLAENLGVTRARNAAVALVDTDLLLFLDDDGIPAPGWVEGFKTIMADPAVWAARGRVAPKSSAVLNDLARAYDLGEEVRPAVINTEGNCAIRHDRYDQVGGFSEAMFGHEGAEISLRILDTAGRPDAIVYTPDAVIHHDYVDDLRGYLRKRYRHGRMLRHLRSGDARRAAAKSIRKSPWTARRVALIPVKTAGVAMEGLGYLMSLVTRS